MCARARARPRSGEGGEVGSGPPRGPPPVSFPPFSGLCRRRCHRRQRFVGVCLFPVRLFRVCTGGGACGCVYTHPSRAVVVARRLSRYPPPPRRGSGLTVPERLVARGSVDPRVGSSALPRFLALRVRLAPVRVPSCRVPARRFKDPRGGRPSAPGVGEAVGPVGGSVRRAFPVPPRPAPSDSQGLSSPGTAAAPEACGPGTVILSRAPPGRPWGPVPCVRLARFPWAAAIAGAGSRVVLVPSFLSRSRPFSFLNHVSFRFSRWPARGESPSPIRPPSAEGGGRGGRLCRRQQTREFAHTRNFRYDS